MVVVLKKGGRIIRVPVLDRPLDGPNVYFMQLIVSS
jgi:hypothetical protein